MKLYVGKEIAAVQRMKTTVENCGRTSDRLRRNSDAGSLNGQNQADFHSRRVLRAQKVD